ncbi:hypothetical protein [Streptomyces bullii]|uniref:Uncharacterized protein n=1 Tax=Streptomyces bullii TaxID=349910 RepID=A0ABW0UV68_9ACTN
MSSTMTFILEGRDRLSRVLDQAGDSAKRAEKKLAAFGAAIPAASAIAPFAGAIAGAGVAVAAFGLAVGGQIGHLAEASQAQKKYQDAVEESGASSAAAVKAELEMHRTLAKMPPATREAAAALTVLKREYREWSDDLADDTAPVLTKGMQAFTALLPKTSGLVRGASNELDRLMTIVGGGMSTPGFDRFMGKVERFAVGSLRDAVNGILHLSRVADSGEIGGSVAEFMDFAREQGPLVGDTLKQIAIAAVHLLQAASGVGVGLLQIANAAARVVASLPPGFIATLMQIAIAIRVVTLTRSGVLMLAGAFSLARTQIMAMGTAAIGASGTLGTLRAMFMALSATARIAVAATGIGLLAVALYKLSNIGKSAPPDVDRLTTSLGELARTGKASGEAAKAFGQDLGGLADSLRTLARPSNLDKAQQFLTSLIGMDSTPIKEAKADLDAVDKALANLVRAGKADVAEAAFNRVAAAMREQGMSAGELRKELGDYKSALADQRFEAELAAQSMGLFGRQAQQTQQALAAQKLSADGLRQSLQALNNVQRQGLGGMIAFEGAIDAAAQAAKDNAGALSMSGGKLNLNSEKARNAAQALSDLAARTDEAAASARENGESWTTVNGIYERGRAELIKNAQQMGLTRAEAARLADQILKTPRKTAMLKADISDWKSKISAAEKQLKTAKGDKRAKLTADIANWKAQVARAELQLKGAKADKRAKLTADVADWRAKVANAERQLRTAKGDKRAKLTADIRDWQRKIAAALRQINSLPPSRSTKLTTTRHYINITENRVINTGKGGRGPNAATGGLWTGSVFRHRGYSEGGLVDGPGTETSDSVFAPWLSRNEFVVKAKSVAKYGVAFLRAVNEGRLSLGSLAGGGGGLAGAGAAAAGGLAGGMAGGVGQVTAAARRMAAAVVTGIKAELQIASPSKKTAALAKDVGKGFIQGLTGSRDKIKSVAADLAKDIKAAFSGRKESSLLRMVDRQTKKLLDLAAKRDKIAAQIAEAKSYASEVTKTARQGAGLTNLGMEPDQITAGGIKGGLAQKLAKIRRFTTYIKMLAKRGLNKGLLRQILDMGPEQGYAYASALAGADKATFTSINKTQAAIDKESKRLGMTGADILYDSGKNAGKGFLKGLEGQKKSIEKLMIDIAKGMQKAIKKALGIKSPSTVMAKLGAYSTEGLARGLVDGVPVLDRALSVVTGRVASAQPSFGRANGAGRGGGTVIHIHVDGVLVDRLGTARAVREALLELKRAHGGTDLGIA